MRNRVISSESQEEVIMQYREYGKTGKRISILSAGGMRYSDPAKIDEMARIPLEAARLGVNYFDTGPGYCDNQSETILGAAVKQMKKEKLPYYIATKTWAHSTSHFWEHIEKSLKTLDVDHIDFYHAWGVNTHDSYQQRIDNGVIKAFREAKEKGMIKHIVCSSHMSGPDIAIMVKEGIFEGILLGYCAVNFPFRIAGVRASHQAGMGVVTMNPLGGGMITDCPDRFGFIRTHEDQSMLEAALQFNLSHPEITSALVGFRSLEDVRTAVNAVESFKPVTDEEMTGMKAHIEDSFNELCTTCNYCKDCPEQIPVARLMEAYNHYLLYGKEDAVFDRLNSHWSINDISVLDKCTECRLCEEVCNQKLPIIDRYKKIREFDSRRAKEKK